MLRLFAMLCVAVALAAAVPAPARVALEPQQRLAVPAGWRAVPRRLDATTTLVFALAVPPRAADAVYDTLMAVSTPGAPAYGRHLTLAEVDALSAPDAAAVAAVTELVRRHAGAAACAWTRNHGFARCTLPVSAAEEMLATRFEAFQHPRQPGVVHRAVRDHYTLPAGTAGARSPVVVVPWRILTAIACLADVAPHVAFGAAAAPAASVLFPMRAAWPDHRL